MASTTPKTVFVDTSEFHGRRFNFETQVLSAFADACRDHKVTLLLPHPTELELRRHVRDFAIKAFTDAAKHLADDLAHAPFLRQWSLRPDLAPFEKAAKAAPLAAVRALERYLRRFTVRKAGYEDVDLRQIMRWYDSMLAPFAEGKKRKEFPDALAIAIADVYARKHDEQIAVISSDGDMEAACKRFVRLLYLPLTRCVHRTANRGHD